MSTVAEIESAIERLQPSDVAKLAAWLQEYQQMIHASAEMFSMYEREEASCKKLSEAALNFMKNTSVIRSAPSFS